MGIFTPNNGYMRETFGGNQDIFNADGKRVGYSQKRLDGGMDFFDTAGRRLGCDRPLIGESREFLDTSGNVVGYRIPWGGGLGYYDLKRRRIGHSTGGFGLTEFYRNFDYDGGEDDFIHWMFG